MLSDELWNKFSTFQSAPPVKGAMGLKRFHHGVRGVSIRAPREGGDGTGNRVSPERAVSIRAPREGGDADAAARFLAIFGFNPRPP